MVHCLDFPAIIHYIYQLNWRMKGAQHRFSKGEVYIPCTLPLYSPLVFDLVRGSILLSILTDQVFPLKRFDMSTVDIH
jgi:hypothetical protein